jgi:hypothetical protein
MNLGAGRWLHFVQELDESQVIAVYFSMTFQSPRNFLNTEPLRTELRLTATSTTRMVLPWFASDTIEDGFSLVLIALICGRAN